MGFFLIPLSFPMFCPALLVGIAVPVGDPRVLDGSHSLFIAYEIRSRQRLGKPKFGRRVEQRFTRESQCKYSDDNTLAPVALVHAHAGPSVLTMTAAIIPTTIKAAVTQLPLNQF